MRWSEIGSAHVARISLETKEEECDQHDEYAYSEDIRNQGRHDVLKSRCGVIAIIGIITGNYVEAHLDEKHSR